MQAIDQIVNSAAKTNYMSGGQVRCPIVFRGPNGAASRVGAQHSQCYAAWYGSIPGLKVIAPYSAADCKGLLKAAIRDPNPVIFLENEITYGFSFEEEYDDDHLVEIGKARIVRQGSDITIIAFSLTVKYAIEAAEELQNHGISAEVIDLRTISPIDRQTIVESVKKTSRCITVEEGFPFASVGSEIASILIEEAFDYLDAPIKKLASVNAPLPYAANLERLALPKAENIVAAALELVARQVK
jgi:pyruvate dehydrogenase E1 component beta subunit